MTNSKIYDSLIIGAGAAGLSAALGFSRVQRSCAVFSNNKHRNHGIQHVHAVLGLDHMHPHDIYATGREQIKRYNNTDFFDGTEITKIETNKLGRRPIYTVFSSEGQSWTGRTVVIATGVKDIHPEDLEGYSENWPHNIYQCPFCDGFERKDLPKGVLCWPSLTPMNFKFTNMGHHMKPTKTPDEPSLVTLFTNGPTPTNNPTIEAGLKTIKAYGMKIESRPIVKLEQALDREDKIGMYVHVRNPDETTEKVWTSFVFHKPRTVPVASTLLEQLDIAVTETPLGLIAASSPPFNSTTAPGVFIAGDMGAQMTHVTTALMSGIASAGGAAHYLGECDDEDALERWQNFSVKKARETVREVREDEDAKKIGGTGCIPGVQEDVAASA